MAELQIKDLAKSFGEHVVLRGVDLVVPSGDLVAILGASGSGKTTLLRLVCGFERSDRGMIRIAGETVSDRDLHVPPERRHIGYVAQDGALFPHLSVADNIVFGLPRHLRRTHHKVAELLEMVGLPPSYAGRPPHQLSGGEQQRVALARALAPEPSLVLLDEPFASLDAALRAETRRLVAKALGAAGATALLVTHDQSEALSMGHQVAVLRQGRFVQVASPEILYRRPADAELARFVGEAVLLPGIACNGTVTCCLGTLPLAAGMPAGAVDVLLRPEQIRLIFSADPAQVRAKVCAVTYYGHDAGVRLLLTSKEQPVMLSARVSGHSAPRPGDEVGLFVESEVVVFARKSSPISCS